MLGSVRGALSNERPYRDKVPWFRMPTLLPKRKATRARAPARAPGRSGVVRDPGMHARSGHGNREISRPTTGPRAVWSASGRRGAVADDARAGEVRPRQRSGEAGEQRRATGRGGGGAKGRGPWGGGKGGGGGGSAGRARTRRAQDRASVSQGLDRVRHVSPSDTQGGSRVPELGPLGSGAARLAAIPAGESPANRGVQLLL